MKLNFKDLTDQQQDDFQPTLFMIMAKRPNDEDSWEPKAWQPAYYSEEDRRECPGRLYSPDGAITPVNWDPLEVYEYDTALKYIALQSLNEGVEHAESNSTPPSFYRLVPVFTGLERKAEQRVMIFVKWYPKPADPLFSDHWEPRPCIEGWEDDGAEDWVPLLLAGSTSSKMPLFTPERAAQLIELQTAREVACGRGASEYYTVLVSE